MSPLVAWGANCDIWCYSKFAGVSYRRDFDYGYLDE